MNQSSDPRNPKQGDSNAAILWSAFAVDLFAVLFARALWPDLTWLTGVLLVVMVAILAGLIQQNRKALKSRAAAYGVNSLVTVILVVGIVGLLNFLAYRYPQKLDLTKNKVHTLSEQTVKLVKGLDRPVKAILFSKVQEREKYRPLLDNYRNLNAAKFDVEYVDPDKEPTRAKQAAIKKYGTLQLVVGEKDSKIDDATEEKVTNALIKLLKTKSSRLCALTGHGEKSFGSTDPEGYDTVKKALEKQFYEQKDVSLIQEGKVPADCDAIAIIGPSKAFFDKEAQAIRDYLGNGGRGIIALDLNLGGGEGSPELISIVKSWYVDPVFALVVDPLSKMFQLDASVPLVTTYSKENAITKDFQGESIFPLTRPIEPISGAPAGLNVQWLAKTTPKSFGETSVQELKTGQVKFEQGVDKQGPISVAAAVEGKLKDSKAPRNTRLVVLGTSAMANNNYSRFGGNLDFFMNAVSWILEDESMIAIRAKEEEPSKVELSQRAGNVVGLLTVIVAPLLIAIAGIVIWVRRRKL